MGPQQKKVRTLQEARNQRKLDKSCISNPKAEISNWTVRQASPSNLKCRISDLRCRIRPISNSSFPGHRLDISEQLLISLVFVVEHDRALCRIQSLGRFSDLEISRAQAVPSRGV